MKYLLFMWSNIFIIGKWLPCFNLGDECSSPEVNSFWNVQTCCLHVRWLLKIQASEAVLALKGRCRCGLCMEIPPGKTHWCVINGLTRRIPWHKLWPKPVLLMPIKSLLNLNSRSQEIWESLQQIPRSMALMAWLIFCQKIYIVNLSEMFYSKFSW